MSTNQGVLCQLERLIQEFSNSNLRTVNRELILECIIDKYFKICKEEGIENISVDAFLFKGELYKES